MVSRIEGIFHIKKRNSMNKLFDEAKKYIVNCIGLYKTKNISYWGFNNGISNLYSLHFYGCVDCIVVRITYCNLRLYIFHNWHPAHVLNPRCKFTSSLVMLLSIKILERSSDKLG